MKLDTTDLDSACWLKVRTEIEGEIESLRNKLEKQQAETDTAELRGRIAALRKLYRISEPEAGPLVEPMPEAKAWG